MGINVDLMTVDTVPWLDHFALKVQLSMPTSALSKLWDPMPPAGLLGELVEDWHFRLSIAIDDPVPSLPPYRSSSMIHLGAAEDEAGTDMVKSECEWRCTHDEATRASYRMCMKVYEMAVKVAKREFSAASIASTNASVGDQGSVRRITIP